MNPRPGQIVPKPSIITQMRSICSIPVALIDAEETGFIGIFTDSFKSVSSGISVAIIFGFIGAIIFKPKG